jgi:hypothetical protein
MEYSENTLRKRIIFILNIVFALFFPHCPMELDVGFIPQFFLFLFFLGHLKAGEVGVETTEARLAPGTDQ